MKANSKPRLIGVTDKVNLLTGYATANGPSFTFEAVDNGDMASRTLTGVSATSFEYDSDGDGADDCYQMTDATGAEIFDLDYDKNGNMIDGVSSTLVYNWDNKLRSATKATNTISLKYDPLGNRIFKDSSSSGTRKYIVDIVGDLPVILMEIDPADSSVKKTYIYANSQILAQHDGDYTADRHFYLHDRLGSVRQIIKPYDTYYIQLVSHYTYDPFGELFPTEFSEGVSNPFKFTGQYFDDEIKQYYLRARMYNPHLYRFTGRDPVFGEFQEPLSLHKYLYCGNEPINRFDPSGLWMVDRWAGHPELNYVAMERTGGFSSDDIWLSIIGSIWTDARKDHWPGRNDAPHWAPGNEQAALAHASGAMELAIWFEKKGMHESAMIMLGTALHTIQDKYCHADAGAGWWEHRKYEGGMPAPDNPWLHPKAYRRAYETSMNWIEVFNQAVMDNHAYSSDLDGSGSIGDGFVWSDPDDSRFYKYTNSLLNDADMFWTSGLLNY